MDQKNFKYFYSVSFNNKYFIVLYNLKYNLYILEIKENGDVTYPQYEDYIEYYKNHQKQILNVIYNFSSDNFNATFISMPDNILNAINNFKKRAENGVKIIPKLIRNGSIILLSSALAILAGCENANIPNKETSEDTTTFDVEEKTNDQQIVYKQYGEITIPYLHSKYYDNIKKKIIYCDNINQFKSYIGMEIKPTYNDIIKVFQENSQIPEDIKETITEEINRMEKGFPDLDLSILFYNAKRMKYIESNSDEMNLKGSDSCACFIAETGEIYINNDEQISKFTLAHEILGHGSTEAVYEDDEKIIYSGFIVKILEEFDGKYNSNDTGKLFSEGVADIIAESTSNEHQDSTYNMGKEAFRIISELNGQTISETINSRGLNLYENMYKLGNINNPVEYTIYLDTLYKDWMSGNLIQGEERLNNLFRILVFDSMDERIEKEGNACIKKVVNILETNTYFPDGFELWYFADESRTKKNVLESYNPHQISESVIEKIRSTIYEKER